jgi:hypothetical protein
MKMSAIVAVTTFVLSAQANAEEVMLVCEGTHAPPSKEMTQIAVRYDESRQALSFAGASDGPWTPALKVRIDAQNISATLYLHDDSRDVFFTCDRVTGVFSVSRQPRRDGEDGIAGKCTALSARKS